MTAGASSAVPDETRREHVRARYAAIASGAGCCTPGGAPSMCCSGGTVRSPSGSASVATQLGYTAKELSELPEGADLGLGCGNPTAILALRPRESVLDLGSGAGIDCFLAAQKVGPTGRVIGVDMTPEMVRRARTNAEAGGYSNVEFRLGEIEHLPVADRSIDVVISNCVVNLAPDKSRVYREAFRVLRPGGRLSISDVVATRPLTERERDDDSLWSSCSSGAISVREMGRALRKAGFSRVRIRLRKAVSRATSLRGPASIGVVPADVTALRPERGGA